MKYHKQLEEIYEQISYLTKKDVGYEILLDKNITPEKIDYFIDNFSKETINEVFSEGEVEEIYIGKKEDIYNIPAELDRFQFSINDITYYIDVHYMDVKDYLNIIENDILKAYDNPKHYQDLINLRNDFYYLADKKICYLDFKTSELEYKLTGNVKRFSYNVFGSVVRAMRQSLIKHKRLPGVGCVYFIFNKQEQQRENIYKKIIKQELPTSFEKQFVDIHSNRQYNKVYIYK
jgi:hypothetical protein